MGDVSVDIMGLTVRVAVGAGTTGHCEEHITRPLWIDPVRHDVAALKLQHVRAIISAARLHSTHDHAFEVELPHALCGSSPRCCGVFSLTNAGLAGQGDSVEFEGGRKGVFIETAQADFDELSRVLVDER